MRSLPTPLEVACSAHPEFLAFICPECRGAVSETRLLAVRYARETLGWPFRHAGRNALGIDCSGVLVHIADRMRWRHDGFLGYPYGVRGEAFLQYLRARMVEIRPDEALPADAFLVDLRVPACHLVTLTDTGRVIHARFRGNVVEHKLDARWARRIVGAFRMRELAHG